MNLEFIEEELGKSTWFAGEQLTGAGTLFLDWLRVDIMMSFPLQIALARGDTAGLSLPRMKAFLKRMEDRPAYQKAVEKGGPLDVVS
jgi:glutathione S-transferase